MKALTKLFKSSKPDDEEEVPVFSPVLQNVRIRMKATRSGCSDGITLRLYEKGREYSISADLARLFCEMQVAEKI